VKKQVLYELKCPTFIKRKRPGESKRSILARKSRVSEKEMKQREDKKLRVSWAKVTAARPPNDLSIKSNEVPLYIGRYLLGSGPKYVPIRPDSRPDNSKLKGVLHTPLSHNYRRRALITQHNKKNYNKNKSSSSRCSFVSEIYNFSTLFSNNPVKFSMSVCALASPRSKIKRVSHVKIKKTVGLHGSDIARLSYRRALIEHELCKILYQQEGRFTRHAASRQFGVGTVPHGYKKVNKSKKKSRNNKQHRNSMYKEEPRGMMCVKSSRLYRRRMISRLNKIVRATFCSLGQHENLVEKVSEMYVLTT
jgi:hypothetical protein